MINIIFNSGFIGFLIWLALFAVSTAALAIAIRCAWSLRAPLFATREFKEKLLPLLQNGEWQGAFDYCSNHSSLAATIVGEVLQIAHEGDEKARQELVLSSLDRRVKMIMRRISSLSSCLLQYLPKLVNE